MNPATMPTVEFAIDLLLQSIYDENKNALEVMGYREDTTIASAMLAQVDNHAGAIKSTLDAVQGHLFRRMSALHTEHNRMIPLHQLPIEIFVQIITEALRSFQTRGWARPTHLGRLVTLCQVCKRWRDVINRTASLWATIDIRDPTSIISTAISRSANHPLNLIGAPSSSSIRFWSYASEGWEEFWKTAIAHSTRWRSIQLAVGSSEAALGIMNAPAPRLQSLELKSLVQCQVHIQNGGGMFQATGPRLRRLGLQGVAAPWRSLVLGDLRHLSLSKLGEFAPSYEEMLGMLRECPELEELMLSLKPVANVETSRREHPFTLARLRSITFSPLSPSWTSALLETIRTPSVQLVDLDLDFSGSGHLLHSVVKSARALFSTFIEVEYRLSITALQDSVEWAYYPIETDHRGWSFNVMARNFLPASEFLEVLLLEKDTNLLPPKSIDIDLSIGDLQLSQLLRKLDNVERIHTFAVSYCSLEPLFTYMSNPTTSNGWGLPELEVFTIYDCYYDPSQLLSMVLTRYGTEGPTGDDILDKGRNRPPPLKEMAISHAPGEADEDTLDLVEDIVGHGLFYLHEDVER